MFFESSAIALLLATAQCQGNPVVVRQKVVAELPPVSLNAADKYRLPEYPADRFPWNPDAGSLASIAELATSGLFRFDERKLIRRVALKRGASKASFTFSTT